MLKIYFLKVLQLEENPIVDFNPLYNLKSVEIRKVV